MEQEVQYIDHMGSDLSVVQAARVSFAQDFESSVLRESDINLINYLGSHNHWTPFAHTSITLRMKAPIPIRTQCFKHKQGFVENEESRRYISSTPQFLEPTWRIGVSNKKQGSGEKIKGSLKTLIQTAYENAMDQAICTYKTLISSGVCEEQARFVLPQGCMVNWYWTGSVAAFARFYSLRVDSHAQVEIQELAEKVGDIISELYPNSWEALTGD